MSELDQKRGVDFIGVTCAFFCHDGNGRILLQKRSQNCRDEQGRWDCGAGALEFGESFKEAIHREVMEEYRVSPVKMKQVEVRNLLRDNNGIDTHWIVLYHAVLVDPDQVQIGEPDKIDEIGWFDIENLPKPLHSALERDLEMMRKHL